MKAPRPSRASVMTWLLACVLLFLSTQSASAHILHGEPVSFQSGFLHPLSGWDHIIAMVAVGIWGAAGDFSDDYVVRRLSGFDQGAAAGG